MTRNMERCRIRYTLARWALVVGLLMLPVGLRLEAQDISVPPDSTATAIPEAAGFHDPGFAKIMVIARADQDSVVLRWAPSTPHGWRIANRTGYVIERRSGIGEFVRLTPDTLHPWLPPQFIDEMNRLPDNPYLGLVLNALWADSLLLETEGQDTLKENAERNTNLFGYSMFAADNDPHIADALGLRFVDRNVKAGDHYTYRVRLNEGREYRIDSGMVVVDVGAARKNPPPANLIARGLDKRIELRWDPRTGEEYTGYVVLRSEDNGKTFNQLNRRPIVIVTSSDTTVHAQGGYTDTVVVNYKVYRYQVRGITPFGELGAAGEVRAFACDLTPPPAPVVRKPVQAGAKSIRLGWDLPAPGGDLVGFMISRSSQPDTNYHDLFKKKLPRTARDFTDKSATDAEPYYIVTSIDTAGNKAPSFPVMIALLDTLPPAMPNGLHGTIDTAGVVRIAWHPNRERNILGYRVLRANALNHEFTQLTGVVWRDTVFTDTVDVRTLTRSVYYRIAAVNLHYNHSRPTPPLGLHRPDMTPPEAPVFSDVLTSDSLVTLYWMPSASSDVHAHVLFKRIPPKGEWTQIASLPGKPSQYVDREVVQNTMYEYHIEAVDSSGLRSPAKLTVQARPFDSGIRPPVKELSSDFNAKDNTVALHWSYVPVKAEKLHFLVYRSKNGEPISRLRSVEHDRRAFVDADVTGPGLYEYAVKVMTQNGAESPLSDRTRVQIPPAGR
jgi:uncharacterized protein